LKKEDKVELKNKKSNAVTAPSRQCQWWPWCFLAKKIPLPPVAIFFKKI
jgi:hypothetical protein